MKVALAYDRINKWGGAEKVLLALHEIFPKAPLYTSVYDKKRAPWADAFEVRTSFLQKFPLPKNAHEYYPYLMGMAFESFDFSEFEVVVSVTHEFAKAIITKPGTLHICYCLTPTGYLWSGYQQYFLGKGGIFQALSLPLVRYLRWYDKIVAQRPDEYVAISKAVQSRIEKYYGRKSEVIYPPVASREVVSRSYETISGVRGYYLVVSRLAGQKRLDIVIEAFNELEMPLKIVGIGREEGKLKKMAKNNIEFLGSLTDEELSAYYKNCRALIVPGEEDFGIVAVEAQSFGKPVIAYGASGALETIVEGKTGWFFQEQSARSLTLKVKEINDIKLNAQKCMENAARFSKERFKREFRLYLERAITRKQK